MSFSSSGVRETFTLKRLSFGTEDCQCLLFPGRRPQKADQVPDDRELHEGISLSFAEAALFSEALRAPWLSPEFIGRTWAEMRGIIRTEQERPQMLFRSV